MPFTGSTPVSTTNLTKVPLPERVAGLFMPAKDRAPRRRAESPPYLDHPGFPEAIIATALGIGAGPADDHVVEQLDVHGLGGVAELACHLHIGGAGGRVAAGVVVHADDRGGALPDGFAKNLARVGEGAGGRAG